MDVGRVAAPLLDRIAGRSVLDHDVEICLLALGSEHGSRRRVEGDHPAQLATWDTRSREVRKGGVQERGP